MTKKKSKQYKKKKQINRIDIVALSLLLLLTIYLFISRPMPLVSSSQQQGERIPVRILFQIIAAENNQMRKQWTQTIVSDGKKMGLAFGEEWRKEGQDKGPLPALFLRETAAYLEKSPIPLSLFLGSDFPINSANKFKGLQADSFQAIKNTGQNQYFFDTEMQRYTAMFADKVVVDACANCHNEHVETPKSDWLLNDIMGATTWAYPYDTVTRDELSMIITELRSAFAKTYDAFLQKSQSFQHKPTIGTQWPVEGYFLPTREVFMQRFEKVASEHTLQLLL